MNMNKKSKREKCYKRSTGVVVVVPGSLGAEVGEVPTSSSNLSPSVTLELKLSQKKNLKSREENRTTNRCQLPRVRLSRLVVNWGKGIKVCTSSIGRLRELSKW